MNMLCTSLITLFAFALADNTCVIGQIPCVRGCIQAIPSAECPSAPVTNNCKSITEPLRWPCAGLVGLFTRGAFLPRIAQVTRRACRSAVCAVVTMASVL